MYPWGMNVDFRTLRTGISRLGEGKGTGEFLVLRAILLSLSPGKKSDEENLFEIITADEVHYYMQAATAKERTEWIKAIQVASRTGK